MFERFSDRSRKAMAVANREGLRRGNEMIDTAHVLLGLIGQTDGRAVTALRQLHCDLDRLRADAEERIVPGDQAPVARLPQTPAVKKATEYAILEARAMCLHYVGTEHLLVGLLRQPDTAAGAALAHAGVRLADVRAALSPGADGA
jgi:ATP-dependent Clp protease ATP-binding subunit ClpC